VLQLHVIRENTDKVVEGLRKRNMRDGEQLVRQVIDIDKTRRETQIQLDTLKAKSNADSKSIGELMRAGKNEEAAKVRASITNDKDAFKTLETSLASHEQELQQLLYKIPNVPAERVPAGKSAEDNLTVHQWGNLPQLPGNASPHWDLIKKYDIIDFDLGNKISGAGFPVYKGKGAKLQRALINFFLDEAGKRGYREVQPPIVVNEASGYGTGQLPDKEGQMYFVTEDGLYLIPTAEVPITNLYRDVILTD